MMRAAHSVWSYVSMLDKTGHVWCISGPGNNGGDAYGVATLALMTGRSVSLYQEGSLSKTAKVVANFARKVGVKIFKNLPSLDEMTDQDIIIDGLLGTGLNRPPSGAYSVIIEWINLAKNNGTKIVSIDIPSGLDASSGTAPGDAIAADMTIMCLSAKQGCYTGLGPDLCGDLYFSDLGCLNPEEHVKPNSILITSENIDKLKRTKSGHKGTHGTLLVLGGWSTMEGAGCLAGIAGLKAGAGKVYICGPEFPDKPMELISVDRDIDCFRQALSRSNAVVAGPGLGNNGGAFLKLAWESNVPLVMDADGLNWLARENPPSRKGVWVGTPHPGEAKTLLGRHVDNRFEAISELQTIYGGEWVLKGAGTLVGHDPIYINPFANSILGTAGSGDVLAGIIGGLLAQGYKYPSHAGVWLHSRAAELLLAAGNASIIASDLIEPIGRALLEIMED